MNADICTILVGYLTKPAFNRLQSIIDYYGDYSYYMRRYRMTGKYIDYTNKLLYLDSYGYRNIKYKGMGYRIKYKYNHIIHHKTIIYNGSYNSIFSKFSYNNINWSQHYYVYHGDYLLPNDIDLIVLKLDINKITKVNIALYRNQITDNTWRLFANMFIVDNGLIRIMQSYKSPKCKYLGYDHCDLFN
jgi:hypothetical protein